MREILYAVIEGEINTPAQGADLLDEEAKEHAAALRIPEADARAQLLAQISDCALLCLRTDAEKLKTVFRLEN